MNKRKNRNKKIVDEPSQPGSSLFRWAMTTLIAFIAAGGGAIAWFNFWAPDRITTWLWLDDNSPYTLSQTDTKWAITPKSHLHDQEAVGSTMSSFPLLHLHISNLGQKQISLNAIRFDFENIQWVTKAKKSQPVIAIAFQEITDEQIRAFTAKYALKQLDQVGHLRRYLLTNEEAAETVVKRLNQEQHVLRYAIVDAPGVPHREFGKTETVDIKIDANRTQYTHQIRHMVEPRATITVPVAISAAASFSGRARISIIYNSTVFITTIPMVEIEVFKPPGVEIIERTKTAE